jgi:hypothetical protein
VAAGGQVRVGAGQRAAPGERVEYRPAWPGPDAGPDPAAAEPRELGYLRRDERGGQVDDHQLPVSVRFPLRAAIWLGPLVLLLDDPWKAVRALPVMLELYLAVNFIRGSDAGAFRTTEGGAFLRQLAYRQSHARAGFSQSACGTCSTVPPGD